MASGHNFRVATQVPGQLRRSQHYTANKLHYLQLQPSLRHTALPPRRHRMNGQQGKRYMYDLS